MLEFVADQLYLIAVAVFAAASFVVIRRSRRRRLAAGTTGVAGLRTAAIASIVPVLILALPVLALAWLLRALSWANPGSTPPVDPLTQVVGNLTALLTLLAIPAVTFLAVLDLYATGPPAAKRGSGDAVSFTVLGTLFSLGLLGGTLFASAQIDAAAGRDAEAASSAQRDAATHAREARSAGLSIDASVADVEFGAPSERGRLLTRLVLEVTLRSATAIDLGQAGGAQTARLVLYDLGAYHGELTEGMLLPAHIPAGFEATYRLAVPTSWSCPTGRHVYIAEACDPPSSGGRDFFPPVAGPWEATLTFRNDVPFDDPRSLDYTTRTDFIVEGSS